MNLWVPVVASFLGGLVAGLFALAGVSITQRNLARQQRLNDERALRDAKLRRLRESFSTVVYLAVVAEELASDLVRSRNIGESMMRREHISAALAAFREELSKSAKSVISFSLESNQDDVFQTYETIIASFFRLHLYVNIPGEDITVSDLREAYTLFSDIQTKSHHLRELAREHLTELEQSMD